MVGDFTVLHTHYIDRFEVYFAVCWDDTKKLTFMCPMIGLVCGHAVFVGKLPMDFSMEIWKGNTHIGVELSYTRLVRRRSWLGCYGQRNPQQRVRQIR